MSWLVELKDIRVVRGRSEVLQGASMQLAHKEWLGLVGANGTGKTVLLKVLATLQQPEGGEILADGARIADPLAWRRQLGMVWQQPVFWRGSVRENLAYPLKLRGKALLDIEHWLDRLELRFFSNHQADTLSLGEAQRLAIGRALISSPRLLLLDDPTANCDLQTAKLVEMLVGEFHNDGGSVIWATPAKGALPPQTQTVKYLYDGIVTCDSPNSQLFSGWE